MKTYLAVDMGASSGRLVAGRFDGEHLALEDVHRFENGGVWAGGHLHWDILRQWGNIVDGLRIASREYGAEIGSVGVDTWGVDFGLLGRNDELLGNPYHYRDVQNLGMLDKAFKIMPREEIFAETGLQFMEFNSLYQLASMKQRNSSILEAAERFLMMPDMFHWLLSGAKVNEQTNASTSQLINPHTRNWSEKIINAFGLPRKIFGEMAAPGTNIGEIRSSLARETGLGKVQVVLPGTHDTASAVMAVPAASQPGQAPDWCYISSGTWSLMGVETPTPVTTGRIGELNFTNEGGVGGTTRLLKNIAGLWVVQECRRVWRLAGNEYTWQELVDRAAASPSLKSFINPDHGDFVAPAEMPKAIQEYCQKTGQRVPDNEGAIMRCALESLALRYRMVLGWLESIVGQTIKTIHIVGGGTQNQLLCQMAADACNRQVIAGPVEATAIGNLMMQVIASKEVGSIAQAREIVRNSFYVQVFEPQKPKPWDEAYEKFQKLV